MFPLVSWSSNVNTDAVFAQSNAAEEVLGPSFRLESQGRRIIPRSGRFRSRVGADLTINFVRSGQERREFARSCIQHLQEREHEALTLARGRRGILADLSQVVREAGRLRGRRCAGLTGDPRAYAVRCFIDLRE
jgi:hypothetical protein